MFSVCASSPISCTRHLTPFRLAWYRCDIVRQVFRSSLLKQKDVHSRLMASYPKVPHYRYALLFAGAFVIGMVANKKWDTGLPFWAYLLAIILLFVLVIPTGMIQAITNQVVQSGTMIKLIIGYVLPGRPVAMMVFKTYGVISMNQAVQFSGDLKLDQYMKIPLRIMFISQALATFVSCTVVVLVQGWMFANIEDLCSPLPEGRLHLRWHEHICDRVACVGWYWPATHLLTGFNVSFYNVFCSSV
jgi:OPT family oligopeptide transporter